MQKNALPSSEKTLRPHVLYDKKGDELINDLEKNYYGSSNTNPLLFEHGQITFKPTTARDHLATPFRPLLPRERGGGNWLILRFAFMQSTEPYDNCLILVQDDKFNLVETVRLVDSVADDRTHTFVHPMEIKKTLQGFRLVITSQSAKRAPVPTCILVEQVSDDHPIISERLRTRTWVAVSLPVVELGLLDEKQLYRNVAKFSTEQIRECYGRDPWVLNYVLNAWECVTGQTVLDSYPYDAAFAINANCNANCTFCLTRPLRIAYADRRFEPNDWVRFKDVLGFCRSVGIPGPGEPLLNPHFEELIVNLGNFIDKRCNVYLITNGLLVERHLEFFRSYLIRTYDVSLNAASPRTYSKVMGVSAGNFDRIVENIRRLADVRVTKRRDINVNITYVVTNQNLHEIPDFVELGNRLKVNGVYIRPYLIEASELLPREIDPDIEPSANPQFKELVRNAERAIRESKVPVYAKPDTWGTAPLNTAPHKCSVVYSKLYLHNDFFKIWPCCVIRDLDDLHPIDYDGTTDFHGAWNSRTMVKLRERLVNGPLYKACHTCRVNLKIQ